MDGISNKLDFSKISFAEWSKQISTSFTESEGIINKFRNTLKTALFIPEENNKDWKKNKLGEIVDKDNIDLYIPQLNNNDASNLATTIRKESISITNGDKPNGWGDLFSILKNTNENYIVDLIKNTDDLSKLTGDDLVQANQSARDSVLAHNEAIKAQSFSAKAGKVALQALAVAGNMIAMWGVSFVVSEISKLANAEKEAVESAREAAGTYKQSSSDINDYAARYSELREQLLATNGDEEKTYNIKKQLLDLQTELNGKYGEEHGYLNLVTNAYKDQTDAIKELNKESANKFLNENESGINTATRKMESKNTYDLSYAIAKTEDNEKFMNDIVNKYKEDGMSILDAGESFYIKLDANPSDAYDTINSFLTDVHDKAKELGNENLFKNTVSNIASNSLNKAKETLNKYQEIYFQAKMAQIASDDNLSDGYDKATSAVEKYNEAILKSNDPYNDENVATAWNNLQTIKQSIQENTTEWGAYSDIMEDVFSAANDNVYSFYHALQDDSSISGLAKTLKGLSDMDLQAMYDDGDNGDAFDKLLSKARAYGIEVQDLIDLLIRLGFIQGEMSGSPTDNSASNASFQQAWDSLDTTENESLNGMKGNLLTLAGTGRLTGDTFNETEGSSTFLSMLGIEPDDNEKIEALILQINELKSSSEQLSSMKNGISGLSDNLSYREENPGEAISSDVLAGMDSGLKEQTAEWEHYESVLGNAGSSMDEVREATNKLASAYVNSNNFLANLTEANEDYYVSQLDEMGVANSAEVVEERLTAQREISQHKAEALSLATDALASVESSYAQNSTDSINAAYEQSAAFVSQSNMTDYAKFALADLIAHQTIFSSNTLNTSDKIASLSALANAYLGAAAQASFLNKVSGGLNSNYRISPDAAWKQVNEEFSSLSPLKVNAPGTSPQKTPTTGGSTKSPDKQPEKKEFKESFNWLERFIKRLKSSFDKWLAQAETALTSSFLNIYYRKAASFARSQLSTYSSAYNKNMEKANAVGLDGKYAEKVRNGALDIDTIEDEGLAKKIKEYQDWYDKAQDAMDSFRETAEKLYNLPLDKAAKKVDIFSNAIDLLNKELDNKTKYTEKNKIINKQTAKEKQTLNAYKKAEKETKKSLSSAKKELLKNQNLDGDDGITARERKIIQKSVRKNKEVNLSRFTENSTGYQAAVKYNEALKARKKAGNDRQSAQQDYNRWKVEASKLKFDNIADHYDKKIKQEGYRTSAKDNKMSELEAAGRKVNISYYKAKKTSTQKNLNQYEAEKRDLEKSLTHIKRYTDEWYDAKDQIQQVSAYISDCVKETYELNNAINQLHFDMFDDISDSISRIITEQEFLQGLFAHEKSTDTETGKFTEAGLARLGSLSTSYYASKNNADRDKTEVDELRRMLDSGTLHSDTLGITFNSVDDLQKKLDETYTKWQDDIKQTHSLESALADIVKEKYQAELDKLQELINARKEAMNAEKDLHDYQRTISQKTRDIATVRKQIAAYSGDTSEEGRAKLQRLQKELDDKNEDLRETEYNRLISDQQAMLDKLYEQYRELTEKKMDDFHALAEEGRTMAQENAGIISSYLSNIATANDYRTENQSLLTGISGSISTNVDNIIKAIAENRTNLSGTKDNNEGANSDNGNKNNNNGNKNNNKKDGKKKKKDNKKNNNKKKDNKKKPSSPKKNSSSQPELVLKQLPPQRINTIQESYIQTDFSQLDPLPNYLGQKSLFNDSPESEILIGNTLERDSIFYAPSNSHFLSPALDSMLPAIHISDVTPDPAATPDARNLNNIINIDSITLPNVTNYDEFKDKMFHDMQNDGHYIQFVNDASLNRTDGMGRLLKNTQLM